MLDVAARNGNASLAAARRYCKVTSTDYVGELLQRGAEWACAERLKFDFQTAGAEELPLNDASQVRPVMFNLRYRSAEHFVDIFRTWYGPVHKAFAAVASVSSAALKSDLIKLLNHMNCGGERSLVVPSEYLEIVITRS